MPEAQSRNEATRRLDSLVTRLDGIATLDNLDRSVKRDVARWIVAHAPYAGPRDLEKRLAKTGIRGLKPHHQRAVADSFRGVVGRRPFLAGAVGAASLGALAVGGRMLLAPADSPAVAATSPSNQPLFGEVNRRGLTVGQTLRAMVAEQGMQFTPSTAAGANWAGLVHALDMSNWIGAADFLYGSELWQRLEPVAQHPPIAAITQTLLVLHRAWDYLLGDRTEWQGELFEFYVFGKMPTLAAPGQGEQRYPGSNAAAQAHIDAINRLAGTFNLLEVLNQRYQSPGTTTAGAPVRCTQGHNFTYAHAVLALENAGRFPPGGRRLLVNWDAHADLGMPFGNLRVNIQDPMRLLESAASFEQRLAVTSYMDIAGWILALTYEGRLANGDEPAELLWICPREAQETSHGYMPPYGEYSITVGDWDATGKLEVGSYSEQPTLSTVATPDMLNHQRELRVHSVDPDDAEAVEQVVGDAQVFLSGDVDYSGTRVPGLPSHKVYLPDYPLDSSPAEEARHQELIAQFGDFYRRYQAQVRAVSIANSPNYTVDEATRKPAAAVLRAVTGDSAAGQPAWIPAEWNRVATPAAEGAPPLAKYALAAGGATGLAALVGALEVHRRRVNELRSLGEST